MILTIEIISHHIFITRAVKRAKVMFSQACVTHSIHRRETSNASWDRSHGLMEEVVWPWGEVVQPWGGVEVDIQPPCEQDLYPY